MSYGLYRFRRIRIVVALETIRFDSIQFDSFNSFAYIRSRESTRVRLHARVTRRINFSIDRFESIALTKPSDESRITKTKYIEWKEKKREREEKKKGKIKSKSWSLMFNSLPDLLYHVTYPLSPPLIQLIRLVLTLGFFCFLFSTGGVN